MGSLAGVEYRYGSVGLSHGRRCRRLDLETRGDNSVTGGPAQAREREIVEGADLSLRASADEISSLAEELDSALLRVAATADKDALDPEGLRGAVATNRAQIHHLTVASILIRTAGGGAEPDMSRTIGRLLTTYEEEAVPDGVVVDRRIDDVSGVLIDARAASAVIRVLKRGLDNALEHSDPVALSRIAVEAVVDGERVRLTVSDDGGGVKPDRSLWGTGLLESEGECEALGGKFDIVSNPNGVTVLAQVPVTVERNSDATAAGRLAARARATALEVLDVLAAGNVIQGVGSLLSTPSRRERHRALAAFGTLVAVWHWRGQRHPWAADAAAPLAMLIWPSGGLPPDGWACSVLADKALRHQRRPVVGALLAAGVGASTRWRHSPAPSAGTIVEKSVFPALGAALGVLFSLIESHLSRTEADLVDLAERLDLLEQVAKPVRDSHDLIDPLRKNPHEWIRLLRTGDGQRLQRLGRRCKIKADAFVNRLATPDPVGAFQSHLADRLAPAEITVSGWLPRTQSLRPKDRLLSRARASVALAAWAEDLGDLIREQYPPTVTGRPSLQTVHVAFAPERPVSGRVTITLLPTPLPPRQRHADAAARRVIDDTATLGGEIEFGSYDGRVSATLPAHVFSQD